MSISGSFLNALSGLRVSGRLTDVASNNLANALTDGYGRQIAEVSSSAVNGFGSGSSISALRRASAPEFTSARRQADADTAAEDPIAAALARIGTSLGNATDVDGLFRRLESFETTLRQFAETPESEPRQIQTIDAAKDLVSTLNSLSVEAAAVRENADATIARHVDTVNGNLHAIHKLNGQIQRMAAADISVHSMVDERERLIDEVNAIIPVRVQPQEHDVVHLYTAEGIFLLQDKVAELQFSPTPVITAPMSYVPGGGGALSGITLRGIDVTPGNGNLQSIGGGALAGEFEVRDTVGSTFHARIDQFAADLISRFQDPAVDPTLGASDPGLFTDSGAVLDPLNIEGLAGRLSINALADPAQGGSAAALRDGLMALTPGPETSDVIARNLMDALSGQRNAAPIPGLAGTLSASGMVAGIVELTGIARSNAESEAARQKATRETLAEREADRLGVNQDEELQRLLLIEQAFNANITVIQTAARMLDELTGIR